MITSTVHPRINDLGPAGHVHNTALPAWFQQARRPLLETFRTSPSAPALPLMIKEYTVMFHQELRLTPDVEIDVTVERVGNSSFVFHEIARQNGQVAAESRVVYIYVGENSRPARIPDEQRAFLEHHLRISENVMS